MELPSELWPEILARLPAIDLVRFRCVSTTWRSLIDSPYFIHRHLNLCNPSKSLLLTSSTFELPSNHLQPYKFLLRIALKPINQPAQTQELTTLNPPQGTISHQPVYYTDGLLLLRKIPRKIPHHEYILFNPSIRKLLVLPPPPVNGGECECECFLGFDPLSNEHKVFMLQFPTSPNLEFPLFFITEYSLSTGCWRSTTRGLERLYRWNVGTCVYTKGVMHWMYLGEMERQPGCNAAPTGVLSFDIGRRNMTLTNLPDEQGYDWGNKIVVPFAFGESLAVLDECTEGTCIRVLELTEGGGVWRKLSERGTDLGASRVLPVWLFRYNTISAVYVKEMRKVLFIVNGLVKKCLDVDTLLTEDPEVPPQCSPLPLRVSMGMYVESLLLANGPGMPC